MEGLWTFLLLSFGAGLAALLTPCVFPMVPLTVSFFSPKGKRERSGVVKLEHMEGKRKRNRGIQRAVLYGVFIILIYVLAGTVVAQVNGPGFANWLSTHWLPNVFFFLVFLVFALSFLGMFELTLPTSLVNRMDGMGNKKSGWMGIFFMAFTLVLVSFSCTGPIVGSVLVLSAGGEVLKPIVGMFGFSLALAFPFGLFAAFPHWMDKLPRSGGWLEEVKITLGFLELALALKFLSIADQVYHWRILDREVYLALWITVFGLLGLYLLGKVPLGHDREKKGTNVPKLLLSVASLSFTIYMVPGMFGAPLNPLSGYLPPLSTQAFVMESNMVPAGTMKTGFENNKNREGSPLHGCPEPKYTELLKLPHGLEGYFDLEQAKECARTQDKPIFIDFTGHGCVNCREMEARVWSDPLVLETLKNDYVVVALYVDEKKELPEETWYTSQYDGKIKRTMGRQNMDYQITRFNNNAQPFYVLIDADDRPLTGPKGYDLDTANFIAFLREGTKNYNNQANNIKIETK